MRLSWDELAALEAKQWFGAPVDSDLAIGLISALSATFIRDLTIHQGHQWSVSKHTKLSEWLTDGCRAACARLGTLDAHVRFHIQCITRNHLCALGYNVKLYAPHQPLEAAHMSRLHSNHWNRIHPPVRHQTIPPSDTPPISTAPIPLTSGDSPQSSRVSAMRASSLPALSPRLTPHRPLIQLHTPLTTHTPTTPSPSSTSETSSDDKDLANPLPQVAPSRRNPICDSIPENSIFLSTTLQSCSSSPSILTHDAPPDCEPSCHADLAPKSPFCPPATTPCLTSTSPKTPTRDSANLSMLISSAGSTSEDTPTSWPSLMHCNTASAIALDVTDSLALLRMYSAVESANEPRSASSQLSDDPCPRAQGFCSSKQGAGDPQLGPLFAEQAPDSSTHSADSPVTQKLWVRDRPLSPRAGKTDVVGVTLHHLELTN